MQREIAAQMILVHLLGMDKTNQAEELSSFVGLNQIRMWIIPQKAEHDNEYDINRGYFEHVLDETLKDLVKNGLVDVYYKDDEDGDGKMFALSAEGLKYILGKATADHQIDM
jgi:hypothetical protein